MSDKPYVTKRMTGRKGSDRISEQRTGLVSARKRVPNEPADIRSLASAVQTQAASIYERGP